MVDITQLRSKIENKVFNNLGSTCLVSSSVVSSADKWGDGDYTSPTGVSVTFVPWSVFNKRESFEAFGELQQGDMDAAFKYDQALAVGYEVSFNNITYIISAVEEFHLKDGILVKVARLRKEL